MTDNPASTSASYVDSYSPPTTTPTSAPAQVSAPTSSSVPSMPAIPSFSEPAPAAAPVTPVAPVQPQPPAIPNQWAPAPLPPIEAQSEPTVAEPSEPAESPVSQALEDQNIFFLLGVTEASDDQKDAFLDELQQVIWEDFLENDVELLITEEEMTELKALMAKKEGTDLEQQEAIVTYLEKLIPDLEEIMLEKALELKADMVKERIGAMKEYYADKPEVLEKLTKAESLVADDHWREAAEVLNAIK